MHATAQPSPIAMTAIVVTLVHLAACAAHRAHGPRAPGAQTAPRAAAAAATTPQKSTTPVQVSPSGLTLPLALGAQSVAERQFAVAAGRALRQIYDEDHDDAALVEALAPRLQTEALAHLAPVWAPLLEAARLRAEALAAIAPGLRALRRAYADVYFDEVTQSWRQLDAAACQQSHIALDDYADAHPDFIATIEPVGPWPLVKLLATCRT